MAQDKAKRNKIIAIILAVLIALAIIVPSAFAIAGAVLEPYARCAYAAKMANIDRDDIYRLMDDAEVNFDGINYLIEKGKTDKTNLFTVQGDLDILDALGGVLTSRFTSSELADFLYNLLDSKEKGKGLEPIGALMQYADSREINRIKKYRIVKKLAELDINLTPSDVEVSHEEWHQAVDNLYKILTNIKNGDADEKLVYANDIRRIALSSDVMAEVPIKDIAGVIDYTGTLMKDVSMPSSILKIISKYFLEGKNEVVELLGEMPIAMDSLTDIIRNITREELVYNIFGDYPRMERVANNIAYVVKTKVDASRYEIIAREFAYFASRTFDKEHTLDEQIVMRMITSSRNIDEVDFTEEEYAFWDRYINHFFPENEA